MSVSRSLIDIKLLLLILLISFNFKASIIPNLNLKFDIVFIDADKENYSEYLKMILPNMNKGAVLITDNILWHGKVVNQDKEIDYKTRKIAEFNKNLANESSIKSIIIPIRDGISIAVKL